MSASPVLVFGSTGAQGGSVARSLLKANIPVRAVTRNPQSDAGKALAALGAQVVAGDISKPQESLFTGVSTVFLVTVFGHDSNEFDSGKPTVDLAAKSGVKHFIYSSLPNVEEESGGKYNVPHFTDKAKLENYIKSLNSFQYTTFPFLPFYYQNFQSYFKIKSDDFGNLTLSLPKTSKLTFGDVEDIGPLVLAVIKNPEKYGKGNQIPFGFRTTPDDIAKAFSTKFGRTVNVNLIPLEVYATFYPGAAEMSQMFGWINEFDSFGKLDPAQDLFTPKTFEQWLTEQEFEVQKNEAPPQ